MLDVDLRKYTGTPETVLVIMQEAYGPYGAHSWTLRKFIEEIVKKVTARDYWSEALAVYYTACSPAFRYTHDPGKVEQVKSPERMVHEVASRGVTLGDCDDLACFILGGLSTIGVPARLGTGAFDLDVGSWKHLTMERPEPYGFSMAGTGYAGGPFTHVWAEGLRPDGKWAIFDPVAGPSARQMRRRLRQVRYYIKQ